MRFFPRIGKSAAFFSNHWKVLALAALLPAGCRPVIEMKKPVLPYPPFGPVRVEGDRFIVHGDTFLVVGVGYEPGCRKGVVPWERTFEEEVLRADFERIRAAGFNTIRGWSPYTDEEIELAAEYGLWVIQSTWFDPAGDFADPEFQRTQIELVTREVSRSAKHPNILAYLLFNEPHADAVRRAGIHEVAGFYARLKETAFVADSTRPVSYANCVMTDFVEPAVWDFVAANVYPYSPVTIEKALGYREYLRILKARHAPGKPLVVTEFGLSVSPTGDGRGYGGNTPERQAAWDVELWNDILNTGCAGGCVFMWTDGWWKRDNKDIHDDHAEEWYGLVETDSGYVGTPRPAYYALQEYNRAIRTMPRDGEVFSRQVPVEVWAPAADRVQARLDDGAWGDLVKAGEWWWRGEIWLGDVAEGWHRVETRALDAEGRAGSAKQCVVAVRPGGRAPSWLTVQIRPIRSPFPAGEPMTVEVEVRDQDRQPAAGRAVSIQRFLHTSWNEAGAEAETDAQGVARVVLPSLNQPGLCSVAAGVAHEDGPARRRYGDYVHVELE